MSSNCEYCVNYADDPETGGKMCVIDLDEDDLYRFMTYNTRDCPYFRMGDEYTIVHKQI